MLHKVIAPAYRHGIPSWIVADAVAFAAIVPTIDDIGKVAVQETPYNIYILKTHDDGLGNPVWHSMLAPDLDAANIAVVDATGYYVGSGVESILDEIGAALLALNNELDIIDNNSVWAIAFSDETTDLTTGAGKAFFHAPFDATIVEVFFGVSVAQASGTVLTFDVNKNGGTIFSTNPAIDNTERTSLTAATPSALSVTTVAKGDLISVDIDTVGTAGARGGKMYMRVRKTA